MAAEQRLCRQAGGDELALLAAGERARCRSRTIEVEREARGED
jgi:hypothetical protein